MMRPDLRDVMSRIQRVEDALIDGERGLAQQILRDLLDELGSLLRVHQMGEKKGG